MNIMLILFTTGLLFSVVFKKSKFSKYIPIIVLFVIICFTEDNYDYYYYLRGYEKASLGLLGSINNGSYLLTIIMSLFSKLGLNYNQFRMAITAIEILMISSTLNRYLKYQSLFWTALIVFPGWWMSTLFRHTFALTILIFGIKYLIEDEKFNTVKFLVCVIFAGLIHSSFWIYLTLILVKYFDRKKILFSISLVTIVLIFARSTRIVNNLINLFPIEDDILSRLTSVNVNSISILFNLFYVMIIFGIGLVAHLLFIGKIRLYEREPVGTDNDSYDFPIEIIDKVLLPINYCSIIVAGMSLYTSVAFRLLHFFAIFNIMSYCICEERYKRMINKSALQLTIIIYLLLVTAVFCHFTPTLKENILDAIINNNTVIGW